MDAVLRDQQGIRLAKATSRLFGWIYTLSWSLSFYPQPILNWRRKSTSGLSIDFPAVNVLGFVAYTISNACFLYSPEIRRQYAARHPPSHEPTVRFNDLAFGAHAVILTVLTCSQFYPLLWGFEVSKAKSQRISKPIGVIICGSVAAPLAMAFIVALRNHTYKQDPLDWAWIDVIYTIGYVKLVVTFVKYIPQAVFNFQRKSTQGWSIEQILFDLTGGILSLLQLIIDSSLQGDWSGIAGNPTKLGLANISMFFDVIFLVQHYVLYKDRFENKPESVDTESTEPLLAEN